MTRPVRETAQIAAAIGREFSWRLLEAVSPIRGPALRDALGQLMATELIYGRGTPQDATYIFKHALVQDTAYASLLRSRRQRIHADIARALEERFADQVETAPAIIAHHYAEAGLPEPAASRRWPSFPAMDMLKRSHYVIFGLRCSQSPLSAILKRANVIAPNSSPIAPTRRGQRPRPLGRGRWGASRAVALDV
jgi:predicted ATPase